MRNLKAALTHLQRDPVLAALIDHFGKLDYRPNRDRFASLTKEIINQQLSGRVADVIWGRFEKLCQGQVVFPAVLKLSKDELRSTGMSWAKAEFILDLAARAASGKLQLDELDQMVDEEVIGHLVQVKGIGRWTAEMVLMFTLHRPDILPLDDVGIQNAFVKHYGLNRRHKTFTKKMTKIAVPWRPFRTVACWYLWKSLDGG